jgi:hypothetical protein
VAAPETILKEPFNRNKAAAPPQFASLKLRLARDLTYTKPCMRRILAFLMLALIGSFLATPLLALSSSDPERNLPACCRRDGHHYCAMMDQALRSTGHGTHARQVFERCPFYPHATAVSAPLLQAVPSPSTPHFVQIDSQIAAHSQTEAFYRLSLDRSRWNRGPPSNIL